MRGFMIFVYLFAGLLLGLACFMTPGVWGLVFGFFCGCSLGMAGVLIRDMWKYKEILTIEDDIVEDE